MTGICINKYFRFPQFLHLTRRHSVGCGGKAYLREKSFCLWALRCEIPCRPESGYSRLPPLSVQHHRCLKDSTKVSVNKTGSYCWLVFYYIPTSILFIFSDNGGRRRAEFAYFLITNLFRIKLYPKVQNPEYFKRERVELAYELFMSLLLGNIYYLKCKISYEILSF